MSPTSDKELNKAALVIAKLLIRTREGKIRWTGPFTGFLTSTLGGSEPESYTTKLEGGIEAVLICDDKQLCFELTDKPAESTLSGTQPNHIGIAGTFGLASVNAQNKILSISLPHSYEREERTSPESIVYRDLDELVALARNPKSVSDDLQLKQVMSYLDRLAG
jgi:hypothetical protein